MRKKPTFAEMQKRSLENRIQYIADHRLDYVRDPRDFSRNRIPTLSTMLKLILGFTGKTIPKELLGLKDPVTASAYAQQRDKLTLKMSFLQILLRSRHPCLRLYPSRYRADSGLSPVRNVRRRAHQAKKRAELPDDPGRSTLFCFVSA